MTKTPFTQIVKTVSLAPVTLDHAARACGYGSFDEALRKDREASEDMVFDKAGHVSQVFNTHSFLIEGYMEILARNLAESDLIYFLE